jgi:predicted phage terminase large subunit-like protein
LYTRREPSGAIIVVMTRWHEDDLVGRLLKNEPDKWRVLSMPAISDEGVALWSERFPIDVLREIETTLGPYSFSALYQQRPTPAEGGIFKRAWLDSEAHPRAAHAPPVVATVRYWDLAMSEKTSADYTAGVKYAICEDGHRYVLDVVHRQIEWGDLTEFMALTMLEDGPTVGQGVEQKGFMSRAIQALNVDPRLHGYQVWGFPADKDKLTRALPAAAKCAAGVVHVLDRHWTDAFLDELCSFPNGAHDDQVDAFAGAEAMMGDQMTEAIGGLNLNNDYISASLY